MLLDYSVWYFYYIVESILLIYCWRFLHLCSWGIAVVVVQSLSRVWLFVTLWLQQTFLSLTISWSSPKFMSIESVMPTNHLILYHLFFLLLSIFPSISDYFPMSWLSPSKEIKVLELQLQLQSVQWIFKVDFLELTGLIFLLSKGLSRVFSNTTVRKINSLVFSLLYGPALTSVHDYWKNHVLTTQTFVGRVMSLLFTTLSRFVIAFLLRSKRLLISWLQSSSAVILELKKRKSFNFSPFYLPLSDGIGCNDLSFLNVEFFFFRNICSFGCTES